jgi:uncharacterized phage-associated protein
MKMFGAILKLVKNKFFLKEVLSVSSILDVARYILDKKGKMTTMKLQKLCYYAQAWSLVWDKPLFSEDFQAWTNGPVCRELYDYHSGKYNISVCDIPKHATSAEALTRKQISHIDAVLETYAYKEPQWLSTLTHLEKPWNEARNGIPDGCNCENVISKESMKSYYGSL